VVDEVKEAVTGKAKVEEAAKDLVCESCGKDDFTTVRGYKGHQRKHETVVCPTCKREFSALGYGGHAKVCTPGPRKRGRPRHPIAETPEGGKKAKAPSGPEVPILDQEEEMPSAEDFKAPEPEVTTGEEAVMADLQEIVVTVKALFGKLADLAAHLDEVLADGSDKRNR
jgi:hypothetical protein